MKYKRFLINCLVILVLMFISFLFDDKILIFFESIRNYYLDYLLLGITYLSNIFIIFFILTSLFLWSENKRRWILPLWLTGFFSVIISVVLKYLIARPRPYIINIVSVYTNLSYEFIKESHLIWNFSFPSFHTMLVFATLPILIKEFKKIKYIWIVFAVLIAISRMYFGVHYLSDVIGGGLIGYLIGYFIIKIEEKKEYSKKLLNKFLK